MSDYRCPSCKSREVSVETRAWGTPTKEGVEDVDVATWDGASQAICTGPDGCGWSGNASDLEEAKSESED